MVLQRATDEELEELGVIARGLADEIRKGERIKIQYGTSYVYPISSNRKPCFCHTQPSDAEKRAYGYESGGGLFRHLRV